MKYWRRPLDLDKVCLPRAEVRIIEERCKGCNYCVTYCPRNVLVTGEKFNSKGYYPPHVKNQDECASCGLCQMICPEFAIYHIVQRPEVAEQSV
ncbi:MAG: 4Fe-4S binding protein [Chloroflexi bacterium]|nr:4Fe-4S binding protein [Chloroflexota bacterium]